MKKRTLRVSLVPDLMSETYTCSVFVNHVTSHTFKYQSPLGLRAVLQFWPRAQDDDDGPGLGLGRRCPVTSGADWSSAVTPVLFYFPNWG